MVSFSSKQAQIRKLATGWGEGGLGDWYWSPGVLESWMMKCLVHGSLQSPAASSLK